MKGDDDEEPGRDVETSERCGAGGPGWSLSLRPSGCERVLRHGRARAEREEGELTRPRAERRSDGGHGCSKFGPLALSRPCRRSCILHDTPSMRYLALFTLCCALLAALAFAEPAPRAPPLQQRRVVPFGTEANLQRDRAAPAPPAQAKHTDEASNNYVRPLPTPSRRVLARAASLGFPRRDEPRGGAASGLKGMPGTRRSAR